MHAGEAVLLDLELDAAGWIALDEVDVVPGDDAGAEACGDAVDGGGWQALEDAADGSAEADLDLGDAEAEGGGVVGRGFPDEVDVVDADDLVAVDVDDLLVEEVALEEERGLVALEGGEAGALAELDSAVCA